MLVIGVCLSNELRNKFFHVSHILFASLETRLIQVKGLDSGSFKNEFKLNLLKFLTVIV